MIDTDTVTRPALRSARRNPRVFFVEEHYQPSALAKRLGISKDTVLRACHEGRDTAGSRGLWPWRQFARRIIIPASAVTKWLDQHKATV